MGGNRTFAAVCIEVRYAGQSRLSLRHIHVFYVEGPLLLELESGFAPAAKGRFPPILLKNSLLHLQIFQKQKIVLLQSETANKHGKKFE